MESVLIGLGASAGTAATVSTIFNVVGAVSSIASGISSASQGRQLQRMYETRARQAVLSSRAEAIKYETQANNVMRRGLQFQAAARARAAAGGVDPFGGSASLVQSLSARDAGEEFDLSRDNAKLAGIYGWQSALDLQQAGRNAKSSGLVKGVSTVVAGLNRFGGVGGPPATEPDPYGMGKYKDTDFGSGGWL